MADEFREIYHRIGLGLQSNATTGWVHANVEAVFYSDSIDYESECVHSDGKLESIGTTDDMCDAIRELRRAFQETGRPTWGQFRFELSPDGKFDVKYGYDNCDSKGNTLMSGDEWLERRRQSRLRYGLPG